MENVGLLNLKRLTDGHKLSQNVNGSEWEYNMPAKDDFTRAQVQQTQYKDAQFIFAEERKDSQGTGLESKE